MRHRRRDDENDDNRGVGCRSEYVEAPALVQIRTSRSTGHLLAAAREVGAVDGQQKSGIICSFLINGDGGAQVRFVFSLARTCSVKRTRMTYHSTARRFDI